MAKVSMVSLGCPKNQVDAEQMLYLLKTSGFEICSNEADADIIIINTCGFIEEAKKEAIENILEASRYKKDGNLKALIVTGCLAERYKDDITAQLPEVDVCVGIGKNGEIADIVKRALKGETFNTYGKKEDLNLNTQRILGGPFYSAYLKIGDGCDNCCTYCAIPKIRGRMRSRTIEDCVAEAKRLSKNGVRELIVVAQDTTAYGTDIYGEPKICELLRELCKIDGIHWIRTLYTYPERITDEFLETLKTQKKLVKYLDIPIQHCDGKILKRMNRTGDEKKLRSLIAHIRDVIPDITLRTTLITGFPGETEADFEALHKFVHDIKFDRLGCFAFSPEEGTIAATLDGQLDEQTKIDRMEHIMETQMTISEELNAKKLGTTKEVLIEGYDDFIKCYFGRSECDAPEIDGKIFFMSDTPLKIGDFVNVNFFDNIEYDLMGEKV